MIGFISAIFSLTNRSSSPTAANSPRKCGWRPGDAKVSTRCSDGRLSNVRRLYQHGYEVLRVLVGEGIEKFRDSSLKSYSISFQTFHSNSPSNSLSSTDKSGDSVSEICVLQSIDSYSDPVDSLMSLGCSSPSPSLSFSRWLSLSFVTFE